MSIVLFPKRYAGERQPAAFVMELPEIALTRSTNLYVGVDPETQSAVLVEMQNLTRSLDQASKSCDRLRALLHPYLAGGVQ